MRKFGKNKDSSFNSFCLKLMTKENFAIANGSCCQQNSSTVELVDDTYNNSVAAGRTQFIARRSTVTPLTPLLQFVTARCYASAVLAVPPSVTSRCSTKTTKRKITQTTSHDTPGSLVFWCQRSPRNSTGVTPYEGAKCRWDGSKSATFDK